MYGVWEPNLSMGKRNMMRTRHHRLCESRYSAEQARIGPVRARRYILVAKGGSVRLLVYFLE